jgi:hypothetical protein
MVLKYDKIFHCKILQNVPKLGFLFENRPSGNPGLRRRRRRRKDTWGH